MVPPSPAPLTPSGLSGEGVSTCCDRADGERPERRDQVLGEVVDSGWPSSSYFIHLEQGIADAVGERPLDLAVDDQTD